MLHGLNELPIGNWQSAMDARLCRDARSRSGAYWMAPCRPRASTVPGAFRRIASPVRRRATWASIPTPPVMRWPRGRRWTADSIACRRPSMRRRATGGRMRRTSPTRPAMRLYMIGAVPNGSCWVRVCAESTGGLGSASNDVRVIVGPPPPGAPVLSGGATGPGTVLLQWTAAAAPGAPVTGYELRVGYPAGPEQRGGHQPAGRAAQLRHHRDSAGDLLRPRRRAERRRTRRCVERSDGDNPVGVPADSTIAPPSSSR